MDIQKLLVSIFLILFISSAYSKNINIELISHKEIESLGDDTCLLEFSFTNNSWGTMYGLKVNAEAYDDRGDKMADHAFRTFIDAFGMLSNIEKIGLGNTGTSKSLHVKGKCKYVSVIKMKQVRPNHCNIRQMPDDANCFDIITASSKIAQIKLIKK